MSFLLEKSKQNIEASKKLIAANLDAASVHCSYYSCVQHMLHIKFEMFNESPESIFNRCKIEQTGSHAILSNEIQRELFNKGNHSESQQFSKNLSLLKRNREAADYHNKKIASSVSAASVDLAYKINSTLDRNFK